jgi:hypothetical protein
MNAARKIQRGWEQTGEINLNGDEKRVLVQALDRRKGSGGRTTASLRLLQRNIRRSLEEDVN